MTTDARTIRDVEALAKRSQCVEHPDMPLRIEMAQGKPNLWCRGCQGRPVSTQTRQSLTSKYKQGDPLPAAIHRNMAKKHGEWIMLDEQTRAVVLRNPDEAAIAMVVEQFRVAQPDVVNLPLPEQIKVAQLVAAYDLQPFHVHIQGYNRSERDGGGKTYSMALTYEGRLFCAKHPNSMGQTFAGVTARAMTNQERIDNLIPDKQAASVAQVFQIVAGQRVEIASGIGRAGVGKDEGGTGQGKRSPIALSNPQEMADTRAKRRALAEAAPLGVSISTLTPSNVWDDDAIEGEARVLDEPSAMEQIAERAGEVVEDARDARYSQAVGTDTPDGEPIEPLDKDHELFGELKDLMEALDYPVGSDFNFLEWAGPDGMLVSGQAIIGLLKFGYSPTQVMTRVVAADPLRQSPKEDAEQLPWNT